MQRRILVVLLPSLEKAPAELESLGKISLSAIRNACSVGLGARIEGNAADVLESLPTDTIGIGPYLCIVDEYAAIVTPGFEVVLTQGRGLGIAAIVASQDYAGILEADQKGAQQMVANTCVKIFMKNHNSNLYGFMFVHFIFYFNKLFKILSGKIQPHLLTSNTYRGQFRGYIEGRFTRLRRNPTWPDL